MPPPNPERPPGEGFRAQRGSQYWIERFANEKPLALSHDIICHSPSLAAFAKPVIQWKSPLAADNYRECRDDFLTHLEFDRHDELWREFWPARGPRWDALGLGSQSLVIGAARNRTFRPHVD